MFFCLSLIKPSRLRQRLSIGYSIAFAHCDKLRAEGKADQTVGEVKQVADKAVDKVKQAVKKLRD